MSNGIKRVKGAVKEAVGTAEKTAGRLTGSERLQAKGRARELDGRAEQESAKTRERVKGKVEEVAGKVQKTAGDVVGDDETQAKGKLREVKGQVRQKANE
jgi:uncharacterized protein YjbJ (UPF0337 family)